MSTTFRATCSRIDQSRFTTSNTGARSKSLGVTFRWSGADSCPTPSWVGGIGCPTIMNACASKLVQTKRLTPYSVALDPGRKRLGVFQPEQNPCHGQGVREVVRVSDPVDDPIGKPVPFRLMEEHRAQCPYPHAIELGKGNRTNAFRDIRFDDAARIRSVFERAHVQRDVRPGGASEEPHESCQTSDALRKEHVAAHERRTERFRIADRRPSTWLEWLREIARERIGDPRVSREKIIRQGLVDLGHARSLRRKHVVAVPWHRGAIAPDTEGCQ